jgi:hypothetical protein
VIYWDRAFVEAGGFMSYGSSVAEMFRQVGAIYACFVSQAELRDGFDACRNLFCARRL